MDVHFVRGLHYVWIVWLATTSTMIHVFVVFLSLAVFTVRIVPRVPSANKAIICLILPALGATRLLPTVMHAWMKMYVYHVRVISCLIMDSVSRSRVKLFQRINR